MSTKFTVADCLVRRSLSAVGSYDSENIGLYKAVVLGGMAVHLYAAPHIPHLLRPTTDVDVTVTPRLDARSFRDGLGPHFRSSLYGHSPVVNVLRHVYEIIVNDDEGDRLFIHSYKWTANGYSNEQRSLERQTADATSVHVPETGDRVKIVRAEEIVADKVDRLVKNRKGSDFPARLEKRYASVMSRDWSKLSEENMAGCLATLVHQKEELPTAFDRGEDVFRRALNEYVTSKDIFDITLLMGLASRKGVEFDENYYDRILSGTE